MNQSLAILEIVHIVLIRAFVSLLSHSVSVNERRLWTNLPREAEKLNGIEVLN
jgi:hypothetical protein